jgi:hypothetical protein
VNYIHSEHTMQPASPPRELSLFQGWNFKFAQYGELKLQSYNKAKKSRDSSVGIATKLQAGRSEL